MQTFITVEVQQEVIVCDRCKREMRVHDEEHQECVTISFRGGYSSVFGDGSVVEADFCQHCLKDLAGAFLRVLEDDPFEPKLYPRSQRKAFQPNQLPSLSVLAQQGGQPKEA